ncbi:MAG TPA: 4Fe-4S binding protein [Myxococcales bacterium]|jgi:epoxyqueuosine reductase QueG
MTVPKPPTKEEVRQFVLEHGGDLCGFVSTEHLNKVTPTMYKPSRLWPAAKTAISMAVHLLDGAAAIGTTETGVQNARWIGWRTSDYLNNLAFELAHFLERRGVTALALSAGNMADPGPTNGGIFGELSHRHIAIEAGLGILGKPLICVTPQFGPRMYYITVLTTTEYEPDQKLDWNPCENCDLCVQACPVSAIVPGARTIKKPLCIPNAMPHGGKMLRDWLVKLFNMKTNKERIEALSSPDYTRLHRATVFVVGTFAGCFYCLYACPVGKTPADRAKITPASGGRAPGHLPAPVLTDPVGNALPKTST